MEAVILAGGLGTSIAEETATRPKPMVEICGKPILWHIMKYYEQTNNMEEFSKNCISNYSKKAAELGLKWA